MQRSFPALFFCGATEARARPALRAGPACGGQRCRRQRAGALSSGFPYNCILRINKKSSKMLLSFYFL